MSHLPRRLERRGWAAALAFGLGFAAAWRTAHRAPSEPTLPEAPRAIESRAVSRGADAVPAPIAPLEVPALPAAAPVSATAVRKSELGEWMRFRYDQPRLSLAAEMAVRRALDQPVPLREVAKHCALAAPGDGLAIDLSAHLELAARDATAAGWGCDVGPDPGPAARACECVLTHIADELHATVPANDIPDIELAPYDDLISIRIWL